MTAVVPAPDDLDPEAATKNPTSVKKHSTTCPCHCCHCPVIEETTPRRLDPAPSLFPPKRSSRWRRHAPPADLTPYTFSYADLAAGARDPNIPGPPTGLNPGALKADASGRSLSVGHHGRSMEARAQGVQAAVGRPKVKSLFHAMAGLTTFGADGSEMHPKLVAVDVDAYGEAWTFTERRNVVMYALLHVVSWLVLSYLDPDSWIGREMGRGAASSAMIDRDFWLKLVAQQAMFWVVFASCGLAVVTQDWNEGYSRKVCHVVMYLTPFLMHLAWTSTRGGDASSPSSGPNMPTIWDLSWTVWFQFVPFYLQIKPIRRRSTFFMLVFRAYDRAQDRPYTLTWLLTQLAGGYVIILALYLYLQARGAGVVPPGAGRAILIVIAVNVFGDGLAEPVGIRWGKHPYRTRALWFDGKCCAGEFKRTYEGSAVVFVTTLVAVAPAYVPLRLFTPWQYATAMVGLPAVMTATEACAPHTWDNPFITLVGAVFILLTYELVP